MSKAPERPERLVRFEGGPNEHARRRRFSRPVVAAAWLWLLAGLPFFTNAACNFEALVLLGGTGLLIGIAWLIVTFSWSPPLRSWSWLSVPFAGLVGVLLLVTDWGFALRVVLSEDALSHYVASVPPGEKSDRTPRRVGLFWVDET